MNQLLVIRTFSGLFTHSKVTNSTVCRLKARSLQTYFTVNVEKQVHLTVVFNRKVVEKDQQVQAVLAELLGGLRLARLFHALRLPGKT